MIVARLVLLCLMFVSFCSCSGTPEELAAKHTRRGDEYVQKEKYREAVIEYKNAVKAKPDDGTLHWKLAQASLEAKDIRNAYLELQKAVEINPKNYEALGKLGELYIALGEIEKAAMISDNLVKSRPGDPLGYILKSGLAIRAGRMDEAIRQLKTAVDLDPKSLRTMLTIGNLYFFKREKNSAKEWYDKALTAYPNSVEVHVTRGNFFFASGGTEEGEKAYRKAIELSKDKENLRVALAEKYLFQRRMDDSERELNAIIKEMNSQKARKVLAEIKIDNGKVSDAKTIVNDILKENGKDLEGKYLGGRIALAEGRLDDAKALFLEVVKENPEMARARLYYGLTDIFQGRVDVGKREVMEAVKMDPGNMRARLILGDLHLKMNMPAEAEKEAIEVLRRDPANVQAAVLYGDSFLIRKGWKKAEQVYTALMKEMPKSALGYFKMGLSRKFQGKPTEAAGYFVRAIERNPKDLAAINEYIFALAAAKKNDTAKKVLDEYVMNEPKNPMLWEMAGRFNLVLRKFTEAESAFLKAIELSPEYTQPYYELGVLYAAQRKLPEAEAKFKKVVEKNDKNASVHTLLGVVQNSQGKIEEANKHYRSALELTPKNALAANNLASNIADHGGNIDEALKFAQIAREGAPEDPNVADTLGWIYYKKGLIDMAYPLVADASRRLEKNAAVRYHHGMVLSKKGKRKEAVLELNAALAIDTLFAGADEARKALASIK